MIPHRPASPPTTLGAPGRGPGGAAGPGIAAVPALPAAADRSGALPDPVTFAVLVLQLILLGLFVLLLKDLDFDAARTRAALAGLARSFPTSRALMPADDEAARRPLAPALREVAEAWRAAARRGPGRVAAGSWLGAEAVALTLPAHALFAADGGPSLAAERWLQPAAGALEEHAHSLLILAADTDQFPAAVATVERLRRELVARGAPAARVGLRLDPELAPGTLTLTLAIAPAVLDPGPTGGEP